MMFYRYTPYNRFGSVIVNIGVDLLVDKGGSIGLLKIGFIIG
jgi:hypothetical protein